MAVVTAEVRLQFSLKFASEEIHRLKNISALVRGVFFLFSKL